MAAVMNGGDSVESGKSTALITRDLLGGCCALDSKELDLDLKVPAGWEKRLDLKSGKVYILRREVSNSSTASDTTTEFRASPADFQDLNFTPAKNSTVLDDGALDLKLFSSSPLFAVRGASSSVCTLDKVKSALEMAERETAGRKRSLSMSVSKSSSTSSSSVKDTAGDIDQEEKSSSAAATAAFASGCPSCLLYVLVSRSNPKCPRCNCDIRVPEKTAVKKLRIDLNMSI